MQQNEDFHYWNVDFHSIYHRGVDTHGMEVVRRPVGGFPASFLFKPISLIILTFFKTAQDICPSFLGCRPQNAAPPISRHSVTLCRRWTSIPTASGRCCRRHCGLWRKLSPPAKSERSGLCAHIELSIYYEQMPDAYVVSTRSSNTDCHQLQGLCALHCGAGPRTCRESLPLNPKALYCLPAYNTARHGRSSRPWLVLCHQNTGSAA